MTIPIAGLHAHNEYSLLDGAGSALQHATAAAEAGYIALAETNHGTLAGSLHHIAACRKVGIMPISGCEVYYRPNRKVQGQKEWLKTYYHLTLHAKNQRGWRSLMSIVSESHATGFYGKACVDDELLEKYAEGLVCLTGCVGGRLAKSINAGDDRQAEAWLRQLKRIFKDDLFAEIMPHDLDLQRTANTEIISMANKHGIPLVATNDQHYPTKEWAPTQDVLLMIATNQTVKKREKKREEGEDIYTFDVKTLYHQNGAELRAEFIQNHPGISQQVIDESLRNTLIAAGRTTPFMVDRSEKMPGVFFEGVSDNDEYLKKLTFEGLASKGRGYELDAAYVEPIKEELATFKIRHQTNYMLMVADIVKWAKSDLPVPTNKGGKLLFGSERKKPIMVGPGRGSAAGSKVAWALGITGINPLKYRTQFVRFVNPNRVGLPDIDLDFPPDRVDEVEAYIMARFGKANVVDIIAHSTFGPKACITDVGRVLSVPYGEIRAATKTMDDDIRSLDDETPPHLENIRKVNKQLDSLAVKYPEMWENAVRIQGMVARKSEHAGGVLILPGAVSDYIPVERTGGQKGKLLSAFGERSGKGNALISDYGYVKVDVLRVAELTKQQHAVDLIYENTGQRINLDALEIHDNPYAADPKVMQGFADGKLVGIFQFSATASNLTRKLKPTSVLDLALINAGIRPGPRGVGADQRAARRKSGLEPIEYWHPALEPFLNYTYGEMFFQEQLIEVVHHLGGLTLADADMFRKIASKLYREPAYAREVMGTYEIPIKASFKEMGLTLAESDTVWNNLLSFSDYSFNLAHAAGYAVLAYRDMWLKTYYPREFYAAFLSKGLSQVTKKKITQKAEAVREARSMNLKIMPPDIMESGTDYTVVEGGIRLGLQAIKGIGPAAATAIINNRPYANFREFGEKVPARACNKTGKAALVNAGACDRWQMRDHMAEDRVDELERETIGMSLTSVHSIQQYAQIIEGKFWTEEQVESAPDDTRVTIMGEVTNIKPWKQGNGRDMAFLDVSYGANNWSVVVFARDLSAYGDVIKSRRPLMISGFKSTRNGRVSIKPHGLEASAGDNWLDPIIDLAEYINLVGMEAEQYAYDSIFPEDQTDASGISMFE